MNFFKQIKWNSILLSALVALLGLIVLCNPSAAAVSVCLLIGWFLIIGGASTLFAYFNFKSRGILAVSLIQLIPGIIIVIMPDILVNFVSLFLGLIVLIYALANIQEAKENRELGYKHWYFGLAVGIITLMLSVVVLLYPFESASAVMMLAGAAMLIHGVSNIISIIVISNDMKKMM